MQRKASHQYFTAEPQVVPQVQKHSSGVLLIMPAQLARTKHYFLLNRQGEAVNTRDPPDLQEALITLRKCRGLGRSERDTARDGKRQERGMGKASEEHSYTYFFFLGLDGRNSSPNK